MKTKKQKIITVIISLVAVIGAYFIHKANGPVYSDSVMDVPAFSDTPYVVINNNEPEFTDDDMSTRSYETYAQLDHLGRCGAAVACIGKDLMPTQERGEIGQIKPSGWHTVKYDFVDGKYLYNRCHLIGWQLTGENANESNLITGTRYMNVEGMLPFENMVADYIKETGNHVLYRVTPVFDGDNLLARGVQMEAYSVEDGGDGICFNVYVYNNQPDITIDYATGESWLSDSGDMPEDTTGAGGETYILNINSQKFHAESCPLAKDIKESNLQNYTGSREELIGKGYAPCGSCKP